MIIRTTNRWNHSSTRIIWISIHRWCQWSYTYTCHGVHVFQHALDLEHAYYWLWTHFTCTPSKYMTSSDKFSGWIVLHTLLHHVWFCVPVYFEVSSTNVHEDKLNLYLSQTSFSPIICATFLTLQSHKNATLAL